MNNRWCKNYWIRLLCAVVLSVCTTIPYYGFTEEVSHKNVLFISSYFPVKENSRLVIGSFSKELGSRINCRITVEYMDSESLTDFSQWKDWMTQLFEAYKNKPDIVVVFGVEAWTAYATSCPPEWKNIPVVLGGIKKRFIDYAHFSPQNIHEVTELRPTAESFGDFKVTGYYTQDYFRENMELIKSLQPQVRRISFIYDNRYRFTFLESYLKKIAREAGFEDLTAFCGNRYTTTQLVDTITAQDDSYAILSAGWYTDVLRYPHANSMLQNELSILHSKFFYLVMDQGPYSSNYLGGYYVAAADIGRDLASLTYDVLTEGMEHSRTFRSTPSPPRYYINYKTLLASGIDESRLPPHTVFYNKETSFFHTYFWQVLLVSLFLLAVMVVLVLRMRYYRNLTAVKARMMEEQKELRHKADESNRLKSAFLANMSHEIRTPLNAIVGFSGLLAESENKEEARMYMDIIQTNNDLLLQLINDILDLSKIDAGTIDFIYAETDVVEICRNLYRVYLTKVNEGVLLVCDLPDEECMVNTERNRVTQVLSNFLSNAVKFTENGYIRFGYEHIENGLRFYVSDTGKGIASENLSRVFVRFEKLDKFTPGNGLGMSICKSIVEKMAGSIGVESEPGKGSTFWFELPCDIGRKTENKGEAHGIPEKAEAAFSEDDMSGDALKTILIAEDNESNYLLLSCILKKYYRLEWATDGEQTVKMYRHIHPDLILMDVKMPGMDGLQATQIIRGEDKHIPIIILTANAFAEDRQNAERAGCTAFLSKPVNKDELMKILKELGF